MNPHITGTGEPALLCTPGMAGTHHDWSRTTPELRHHHRTLLLNRPGLGSAPPEPGLPTLHAEATRLATTLDQHAPHGAIVLAHSASALHAEAAARLHPHTIRALILLDPSCEPPRPHPRTPRGHADRAAATVTTAAERIGLTSTLGPTLWSLLAATHTTHRPPAAARAAFTHATPLHTAVQELLAHRAMISDLAALRATTPRPDIPIRILTATGGMPRTAALHWHRRHHALATTLHARHRLLPTCRHHIPWDAPQAVLHAVAATTAELT